jgi:CDP-6-deoxy-D-xylo-4-hexulose-3-dehydrase
MNIDRRVIGSLQNTDWIMNNTCFIGVYPGLTENHLEFMASVIERFFRGERV